MTPGDKAFVLTTWLLVVLLFFMVGRHERQLQRLQDAVATIAENQLLKQAPSK